MRRWISALLAALMLANLAAWPAAALAEVLEHERESAAFDEKSPPVEPASTRCQHGCAGHYGQHFQWHAPALPFDASKTLPATAIAAPDFFPPQYIPFLPFRPPLTTSIRS